MKNKRGSNQSTLGHEVITRRPPQLQFRIDFRIDRKDLQSIRLKELHVMIAEVYSLILLQKRWLSKFLQKSTLLYSYFLNVVGLSQSFS